MKKNKHISILTLSLLFLPIAITSCRPNETNEVVYKQLAMKEGDAILLEDMERDLGITHTETIQYIPQDSSKISFVGERVFAIDGGATTINVVDNGVLLCYITATITPLQEITDVESINHGSMGGILIDAAVGRFLVKDNNYQMSFYTSTSSKSQIQCSIEHGDILEYQYDSVSNSQLLIAKGVGDTVLRFYDKDAILVYQEVIHVRIGYEGADEFEFALSTPDYWGGLGYNDGMYVQDSTRITFSEGSALLVGEDFTADFEELTFNYSYNEQFSTSDMAYFDITNFAGTTAFSLDHFAIFGAGDQLLLYTSNILYDLYLPRSNS